MKMRVPLLFSAVFLLGSQCILHASYSLSLGVYSRPDAEEMHKQLATQGYPVYLLYGDSCEVRMGSYPTFADAEKIEDKLRLEQKVVAKIVEEEEWDQAQFTWPGDSEKEGKEVAQATVQEYADPRAQKIVSLGLDLFGHPYKYGGTRIGKGIDCSYFVQTIFHELGINLPRTSRDQFAVGAQVDVSQLKVGDLLFFQKTYNIKRRKNSKKSPRTVTRINHVGIYIGNGEFIHATLNVKHVTISRLDEAYFAKRLAGARRVLPEKIQN